MKKKGAVSPQRDKETAADTVDNSKTLLPPPTHTSRHLIGRTGSEGGESEWRRRYKEPLSSAYLPRDWLRLATKAAIGAKTLRSAFDWLREEVALLDVLAGLPADGGGAREGI